MLRPHTEVSTRQINFHNIIVLTKTKELIIDIDLLRRGIGKSLKYANSINTEKAIIIGPDELKNNSVTLRDMKTGKQNLVKIKDLPSKIK